MYSKCIVTNFLHTKSEQKKMFVVCTLVAVDRMSVDEISVGAIAWSTTFRIVE
jgi:hypothetical protein